MKNIFIVILTLASAIASAQTQTPSRPKLVIGIVVDQMRWDYLYRYADKYGSKGFKRLQKGYNCENTHIPYVPTYTGPGHACIYTGSVPALHGIMGNEWYDRESKTVVYCTGDTSYKTLGSEGKAGRMSPNRMLTTTITDELRLASNFHSKVIGIALKDRAAILPAGHAANAAYWLDGKSGNWISSSYYGDSLSAWVNAFNNKKLARKYLDESWNTTYNIAAYTESSEDDNQYENPYSQEAKPTFPHDITKVAEKSPEVITYTPSGNTLTFDFAKAAIADEHMGQGPYTDFLAISCSSTDLIGHQFGPNSIEVEDCYIRLDKDIADFLSYLDQTVGDGNYVVFLSADHGASHAINFNHDHHMPSGMVPADTVRKKVNQFLKTRFGKDSLIEIYNNVQFYLNKANIKRYGLYEDTIKKALIDYLITLPGIAKALDLAHLKSEVLPTSYLETFINGYNQKRSGDIQVIFDPAYLEGYAKGTTHGSGYAYDTHIPLLWYGWGVKSGYDYSQTYMTDIAATLAALLHIQEPNGCIGKPIPLMK